MKPIALMLSLLALAACGQKPLTEARVTDLIDKADMAYVKGDATHICNLRAKGFALHAITTNLSGDRIVPDLAAAEELASEREAASEKLVPDEVTIGLKDFCFDALTAARQSGHANLRRSKLEIALNPDGRTALVKAHYSIQEPLLEQGESAFSSSDSQEHQLATRQLEADDESMVGLNEDGDLLIQSTESRVRAFYVESQRDARL